DETLEGDAATLTQGSTECRPHLGGDPAQALDHFGIVAAEAHDVAHALVDRAVGAIAGGAVLDHEQRHAAGGDPGHRAYGIEMMVGLEFDLARRDLPFGVLKRLSPAFEHHRAACRPPHRAAHP